MSFFTFLLSFLRSFVSCLKCEINSSTIVHKVSFQMVEIVSNSSNFLRSSEVFSG